MSASAGESKRIPSTDNRSLWRRMRHTPMRDVLRGRLSARLDSRHVAESAPLPERLREVVLETVHRTRLRRTEKVDVARELVAHFVDATERADDPDAIASAFGEPRLAARLIRRAKRRARGPVSKATSIVRRAAAVVLLFAVVWYAWAAAEYFTARPRVAIDYLGQLNAPALAMADDERAWPLYRAAYLDTPLDVLREDARLGEARSKGEQTDTELRPQIEALLASLAPTLAKVREAAKRPHLGVVISAAGDPEIEARLDEVYQVQPGATGGSAAGAGMSTSGPVPLFTIRLTHLNLLPTLAAWLVLDLDDAARADDADRAFDDVEALCGMAAHVEGGRGDVLLAQITSLSTFAVTCERVESALSQHPSLWLDEQLTRIAHMLAGYQDGQIRMRFDAERAGFMDIVQRVFTDDGAGDGRLCPPREAMFDGKDWFDYLEVESHEKFDVRWPGVGPLFAQVSASRKEMVALYDRALAAAEREAALPCWARTGDVDSVFWSVADSRVMSARYWLIGAACPAFGGTLQASEGAIQWRDATLGAVALELFKRHDGVYPATLDELVPAYLPCVPLDRYTGTPLGYRLDPKTGRPILYSRGRDRVDDAGVCQQHFDLFGWVRRRSRYGAWGYGLMSPDRGDWVLFPPAPDAD